MIPRRTLWILLATLTVVGCSGMSLRPYGQERTNAEGRYVANYTATFFVSCDDCRVAYGKVGETFVDVAQGDWSRSLSLGTLADGQGGRHAVGGSARPYAIPPPVSAFTSRYRNSCPS